MLATLEVMQSGLIRNRKMRLLKKDNAMMLLDRGEVANPKMFQDMPLKHRCNKQYNFLSVTGIYTFKTTTI